MMLYGLLTSWPVIFVLGMLSVPIFKAVLPLIGRALRPVLRAIIREGLADPAPGTSDGARSLARC